MYAGQIAFGYSTGDWLFVQPNLHFVIFLLPLNILNFKSVVSVNI